MEWLEIAALLIGILGAALGITFWLKLDKFIILLKELSEAFAGAAFVADRASKAMKDRKVTKAEAVLLLKAWNDAYKDWCDVIKAIQQVIPVSIFRLVFRR